MKYLKPILKLIVSGLILFFVYKKIDFESLKETLSSANVLFLIVGFVLFLFSQFVSSLRLQAFWKVLKIKISNLENWKLYLIGMYYNLLLPGGIGGDGYKVFYLDKQFETGKKKLLTALIFDRLSGLLGLLLWLCLLFGIYLKTMAINPLWILALAISAILSIIISYIILRSYFRAYLPIYFRTLCLSFLIQGLQLGTCLSILYALGAFDNILPYLAVFLVSSVAAVIPITFGGAGARELTFLASTAYFPLDLSVAISLGVLFYITSVLASFLGLGYSFKQKL